MSQQSKIMYKGQFVNGAKQGFGMMIWPSGQRYEGSWNNNSR